MTYKQGVTPEVAAYYEAQESAPEAEAEAAADYRSALPAILNPAPEREADPYRPVPAPVGKDYVVGPIRKDHDAQLTEYHAKRHALARADARYEFLDRLPHDVAEQFMATHRGEIENIERSIMADEGVDPDWQEGADWDNGPRFSDDEGV